jgi:hypothetical protein
MGPLFWVTGGAAIFLFAARLNAREPLLARRPDSAVPGREPRAGLIAGDRPGAAPCWSPLWWGHAGPMGTIRLWTSLWGNMLAKFVFPFTRSADRIRLADVRTFPNGKRVLWFSSQERLG